MTALANTQANRHFTIGVRGRTGLIAGVALEIASTRDRGR